MMPMIHITHFLTILNHFTVTMDTDTIHPGIMAIMDLDLIIITWEVDMAIIVPDFMVTMVEEDLATMVVMDITGKEAGPIRFFA